ncbi:NEL-type E3 ubiquitin ligase domain-containing protein [Pseudomonas sp. CC120222-01a]|uniref:NEL-type E3 ubiquitin ligase domain-containing protein n=1 Tax=Pseudomonas sp. CC120222-01a TaxID=1378075 RepID=UPI000D911D94|nr:NEL-type E3 ubiquitin ligase domain-containing protein [Pseudomonas sp. CC120222-01a]PVZ43664.1 E3 ligase-like protein (putative virulence factor) [Pseudomonas sp. CC120222-01a]
MQPRANPVQKHDAQVAVEQAFQDDMIVRRLPAWIRKLRLSEPAVDRPLTAEQLVKVFEALRTSYVSRQRLRHEIGRIEHIHQFCRPLLQRALNGSQDVDTLFYRHFYFTVSPKPVWASGRTPQQDKNSYDIPLLDAALANFTEDESRVGAMPRDNCLVQSDGSTVTSLSASAFAKRCRQLDLGRRYQAHLDSILDSPVTAASGFKSSCKALQVASMLLEACKARTEGILTAQELVLILDLCRDARPGMLGGKPVIAKQLSIYGCKVEQVVVLDQITTTFGFLSSQRVLVYIPGDPVSAWNAAADLDTFIRRTLGKRLGNEPYQRFFARFIRRRDSDAFFARVASELTDVAAWTSRDMDQHMAAYHLPLFDHLAQARVDQIKDDAAVIAVPVRDIDSAVHQARHDRLVSAAWAIANVAGLFVPGLGLILGGVMVWDMLKDVFHAVEDWREGDIDAALDHLLRVAESVVTVGITAVGAAAVAREWHQVDELATARLEDGSEKLWRFDLTPFRSAAPPVQALADAEGIYRLQGRCWVNMEGHFYEVVQQADEQWQIVPKQGHGPQLRHNGAGAWRVWCEQPIEWEAPRALFRRLGGGFRALEDEQVDQVLVIHGLDASHLRGLHICGQAPDACLIDTVSRVEVLNRILALVTHLRSGTEPEDSALLAKVRQWAGTQALTDAQLAERVWRRRRSLFQQLYYEQYPVTTTTHVLQRDFASLHRLAAEALLNTVDSAGLNVAAASMVKRIRCIRVYEALLFDTPQNLDLARVVLKLLEHMPGATNGPRWQLFDGDVAEPLWNSRGTGESRRIRFLAGQFQCSDEQGNTLGEPGELFQQLAGGYSTVQQDALITGKPFALHLRAYMARRVAQRRELIGELLDIASPGDTFLAPQRLLNGRIGYPLSGWRQRALAGRVGARNLAAQLRDLYPGFDDEQVEQWLAHLRVLQRDPASELLALKGQLKALRKRLASWQTATIKLWFWPARRQFARGLIDCWRYLVPQQTLTLEEARGYLLSSYGSDLDELPPIPAGVSFSHVADIALRSLQIRRAPEAFLRAFDGLRSLSITNCRLRSLPLTPALAARLNILDVSGNQIHLEAEDVDLLVGCRQLVYLNLSHNPLQRAFSITGMPGLNALMLRNTQLTQMPAGVMESSNLHTLDVGDNHIRTLPFAFYRSRLWRSGRVRLSDNPLLDAQDVWGEAVNDQVPVKQRWIDLVATDQRDRMANTWGRLYGDSASKDFFHLLERLTTSADFQSEFLSRYLALRVLRMLEYMAERPALQTELYGHALTEHCQDNATLRFSDLEVRVNQWKALHNDVLGDQERVLLHLGAQCWRLEMLDDVGGWHAIRMGRPDESLEFALSYRLSLVDELDLPIEHDEMLNPGVANLSAVDRHAAVRAVRAVQSRDVLVDYLSTTRFWREYLAGMYPGRLEVPQALHDELEALVEGNASPAAINRLQDRVRQREINVYRQLTREAVDRHLMAVLLVPVLPWH